MTLQVPARHLKHTRSITVAAYRRDDGLWDIEARLVDQKSRDFPLASGTRARGAPIHDMTLCVTIDNHLRIHSAHAQSEATPYPGECERITPAYERLVGLCLLSGFHRAVRERFAGVAGCTHITELTASLPTAAIQAFAGELVDTGDGSGTVEPSTTPLSRGSDEKPFQIDRCHALRSDGNAVRRYYPRWYRAADPTYPTAAGALPAVPPKESP